MNNNPDCHPENPASGQQTTDAAPWWGYHVEEVLERESWDDVHPYWAVCENCSRCIVAKYSIELHPNAERAAHRECKRLNKRQLRERKRHRK